MRAEIAEAIAHEERTGRLAELVRRGYRHRSPPIAEAALQEKTELIVRLVRDYVEASAEVIDQTLAAAKREGVMDEVKPIFDTATSYVTESVDFIPDDHGLAGLLDDAYLVHGLMQEISHRHRALTGRSLLAESMFETSQRIRRMIGEPTATRLDVAVVAFARRQNVRETVEQIVAKIGNNGLSMDLPSAVAFHTDDPLEDLPDLELGSLGE